MDQKDYTIEQLARENANLKVELHKANFNLILANERIDKLAKEIEEVKQLDKVENSEVKADEDCE